MSVEEPGAVQKSTVPTPETVTTEATTKSPSSTTSSEVTMATSFNDLEAFRKRAPELYQKFMESLSENIIDDFKRRSERVRKAMKKMRES